MKYAHPAFLYRISELHTNASSFSAMSRKNILLKDVNGNEIKLNNLHYKIIFMEFGFSSCKPCIQKLPILKKLRDTYRGNKNVIFINIVDGRADSFETFKLLPPDYYSVFDFVLYAPKQAMLQFDKELVISGYPFERIYAQDKTIFTHSGFSEEESTYYYNSRVKAFNLILQK